QFNGGGQAAQFGGFAPPIPTESIAGNYNPYRQSAMTARFAEGGTTADIWGRAKALGLRLCLAEVGPRLRLVDADQAKGGGYWIGMETITDSDDSPHIFKVGHDDNGRWLCSCVAWPGVRWYPDERLVFTASGKPA
ncbi:MAG: hypothetical protein AAB368_06590, partial [bacterium]